MCGDVSLSLDLLKKRRYNKQTIKKFYPKERGPELKSRNQSVDMTQGVIWKQLAYFALPLFLGNLCQQLYNTADSVIVGKFVGKDALAAVSSSGNLIFMMTGFFMGLFVGAGVIISRYFGAKCYDRLEAAVHTDLAFAMVCGVLLTLVGIFLTPQILVWMRTPEDVLPQSIQYFRLYFMGSLFMIGAAIATVVSQMVSAVLCFRKLMQADGPYRLVPKRIRFELPMLKQIAAQGIPSGVQNSIIAIANVVVQSNINTFGSDAMAGCGSYAKVEGFVFLPITSFAMALTTFTGQNLGAGQYDRAKRGARVGFTCSTLLAELIGLTLLLVAPYAIALFNDDPAVIAIGVRQTRTEALFYFALAFAHSISAVMRGAGRAKMPMYTMLVCWCVIRVTYITLALKVWPDITTIFWAYPITWCLSCVVFLLYYLKADWVHSFQKMH